MATKKLRLLDLFCGAGGAAMGYSRAGFDEIVGVDIKPQPRYPFSFIEGDALEYCRVHGQEFDAIHASPPCQTYSKTRKILEGKGLVNRGRDLVAATRAVLSEHSYVMENVPGAPLIAPLRLCGMMFELGVLRHRLFETSFSVSEPVHPTHDGGTNSHRGYSHGAKYVTVGGHNYNVPRGREAMGIPWMSRDELNEAIPPAYTEYVGQYLLTHLRQEAVA